MKTIYKRCPRCELNYIKKGEDYCNVCVNEMNSRHDDFACDLDLELCPFCKTNYIADDEIMCASCVAEREAEGIDIDDIDLTEWNDYINDDGIESDGDDENLGSMASIGEIDDGYDMGMSTDLDDLALDSDLNFSEIDELAKDEFAQDMSDEDFDDDFDDDDDDDDDDFDDEN